MTFSFRKAAAGETQGELEMPESTPLVFPALDNVAQSVKQSGDVEKQNAFMRYQRPNFATRVADPNHPAFRGSWLTVFSGCKIKPSTEDGGNGEPSGRRGKRGRKKGRKMKSGFLLYLMVVNMPSDQELEAAKQQLEMTRVQNCPATETN